MDMEKRGRRSVRKKPTENTLRTKHIQIDMANKKPFDYRSGFKQRSKTI